MSTVAQIKAAIDGLPARERAKLEALLWAEWDWPLSEESGDPSQLREKLEQAAKGRFKPGDRADVERILKSLE
ncbi:MAG TPA: hypothetical protein VFR76_11325 [Verrucomicrobiae bacterium]|nr:hypothetical protein [Verrucomicrobiae bacterium]